VKRTIVGQDVLLERMAVCLLARGHLLVEGVPGLAKTMAIKTLAATIGGQFQRIQFTPDLVPADVTGTRLYNQKTGEFETALGPVFANLLLADEINRAPAKVQSALLEVMQERQVTIGRTTFPAPDPFLVMATQNPIESEGTYPLPEAQVDRFMLKVLVGYPSVAEEYVVVERMTSPPVLTEQALSLDDLKRMQKEADAVYVDPGVISYAVSLVGATRNPEAVGQGHLARFITYGASPRASINLILAARALAYLRGRAFVLPTDVAELTGDVLRHRMVLSYEALAARRRRRAAAGRHARPGRGAASRLRRGRLPEAPDHMTRSGLPTWDPASQGMTPLPKPSMAWEEAGALGSTGAP
jgi:MoxR-like ATPase